MYGQVRFRIFAALAVGALIAGVGVGVSSGLVTASSHPHPNPTIAVSPSTHLVDLQNVLVVGSHFSPDALLGTVECEPGAVDESSCDLSTLVYTNAKGSGAVLLHRFVRRDINVGGNNIDCAAPNSCILGVGNVDDLSEAAGAPISFDRHVPPVVTKITAVPATKLRDHQLVKVVGQGFDPGASVQVLECANNSDFECAYETARFAVAGKNGALSISNFALEREIVAFDETGEATIDCAVPRSCVLEAQGGPVNVANAPLSFDPRVPPIVPAISVAPSTNLADLQLVSVNGFGFLPGAQVQISECTNATFACDPGTITVTAGFQGQFKVTMPVHRRIAGQGLDGVVATDCAAHLGTCEIVAGGEGAFTSPSVALEFNRNKPPVKPTMTVVPKSGLVDNQQVGVTLHGFAPFRQVAVVECSAEAITEQNLSYCDTNTEIVTTTPAGGGSPSVAFFVRRQIAGQDGLVNCAAKPGACVLVATPYEFFGYLGGGTGGGSTPTTVPAGLVAHPAMTGGALPAPVLGGKALRAANGSSIPGVAVATLTFRS